MKERYTCRCSYVTGVAVSRDVSGAHVDAHVDGRLEGYAKGVGCPRRLVEAVTLSLGAQRQLGLSQLVRSAAGACRAETPARRHAASSWIDVSQTPSCTRLVH